MTKHDPTEEAETLPGIPIAGSDLEKFPSVPGIVGGGGQSIDIAVQEITAVIPALGLTVAVAISAVVLSRTHIWKQGYGSILSPPFGAGWEAQEHSTFIEQPSTTSVTVSRNTAGPAITSKIAVIEYT